MKKSVVTTLIILKLLSLVSMAIAFSLLLSENFKGN